VAAPASPVAADDPTPLWHDEPMNDRPAGATPASYPLRTPRRDDLRAFMAPLEEAFGERFAPEEWADEMAVIEPDRSMAAFDGESPVGFASAYSFRMTIAGGELPVGGLTAVGVLPTHRRRGILRSMMERHFVDCRDRGEPVSILWASEGAIYQRFGYGPGALSGGFDIARGRATFIRPPEGAGRVRFVDAETGAGLIPPLYELVRRATPGALERSDEDWRLRLLADAEYRRVPDGPKSIVIYEEGDAALGYAIIRRKAEWTDRGPSAVLTVVEAIGVSARATRELWAWLVDVDLTSRIRGIRQPLPHPLQLLLAEPRQLGLTVSDGIWLRLVDVPEALGRRSYAAAGSLVLGIRDAACPWNVGRWRLATDGGAARSVERTDDPVDLELDVADLAATYLGAFRFADLLAAGRADEVRRGAVATADRLFAPERTPWCSTMF
jgi:predicted acetyltransferase